ncbi:MAG: VOC family protein [Nostoc sp. NMS1]|jgi:predicted enzyme related to lactoylglutathione lyase|uniref:VOC family protein n=1 Tax=Nostoc TaxID=1177 RepID=UPI0025FBDBA4|nr:MULTISPECIES: VOC family protein [unclassified Nostoc]MBN3906345.1 VOC family protein [Nostoc sp. NMS1]MBN3994611.1 VOC family protein [Nostoc sp. NMS2]
MQILKVLTRVYLSPVDLDEAIAFYENLFTEKCWLWFQYSEAELELASVGSILLIAGSAEALSPFKSTHATFLVDSLNDFKEALIQQGAVILAEPNKVTTGVNMRAMHPDGTIIEYLEFG